MLARLQGIAVGTEPAIAWIVFYQERHPDADQDGKTAKDDVCVAPPGQLDTEGCQRRYD